MSWTFASLVLLGIALGVGFAWYERARPTAKVVALVATLAGLAAVGRIAFAPVPNVKPTTDIVLIAGFALGAGPGFVVGAVAALTSNLFFGQGPWTPWQMVAWGLVGLMGAVLARVGGRDMGRVPLALWCGAAGFGFGAIMDLSTWVNFAGDRTLDRYLAIAGLSLPWNVAHAIGNVVFFLAFGPLLVRSLERFRSRFAIAWQPAAATVALGLTLASAALPARAEAAEPAIERAVSYLRGAQNDDGGWGPVPGARSSPLHAGWVAIGLAAAGVAPGERAAAYFTGRGSVTRRPADLERTLLAVAASGGDTGALAERLRSRQRPDGSFAGLVNVTAFGAVALRAAGAPADDPAVRDAGRFVAANQNGDGGFSFARRGAPSGTDDTGAAVMGLVAAGRRATPTVERAVRYLEGQRNDDGGWPLTQAGASNSQSTAWAVQALLAAEAGDVEPGLEYLRRMQREDGSVRYSHTSEQTPVWVTGQALAALARRTLPVRAPAADRAPAHLDLGPQARAAGALAALLLSALAVR